MHSSFGAAFKIGSTTRSGNCAGWNAQSPDIVHDKFWEKVGNNLIELANCLESHDQVNNQWKFHCIYFCAHIYTGLSIFASRKTWRAGISVAVDVASNLMMKRVVIKFTLEELRDNISKHQCGCRGQSWKFNSLNKNLKWKKEFKHLKVPVINLNAFTWYTNGSDQEYSKFLFFYLFIYCYWADSDPDWTSCILCFLG